MNRNKESVTLNLKSDEGAEAARRLIERADVVVDNFLPLQKESLRFAPRDINASVVHCTIGGFDSDGADANMPGYDLLAQAGSGLMSITGEAAGEPMKIGVALADVLTAHYAFGAICAALHGRERTGEGVSLEVSLFIGSAPPSLGQHTASVLRELGFGRRAVTAMRKQGGLEQV